MNLYYIFRVNKTTNKITYLTTDFKTFSNRSGEAVLMTEAEASDNCGEYNDKDHDCGCGSHSADMLKLLHAAGLR